MNRDYLAELRLQQNETQQDVADALGLTRQYYQLIEAGERQRRMDISLAVKLADHFKIGLNDFIGRESAYGQQIGQPENRA